MVGDWIYSQASILEAKSALDDLVVHAVGCAKEMLTEKDVIAIAEDLEVSRGQIEALVTAKPWLRERSQERLRTEAGDEFKAFRLVSLPEGSEIRPEEVVSLSLDPLIPILIARNEPLYSSRGKRIKMSHVFLWYRIPASRALAYVPELIEIAERKFGDRLHRLKAKVEGGLLSVDQVFRVFKDQKEVIADVGGLAPERLDVQDRDDLTFVYDVLTGFFRDGDQWIGQQIRVGWQFADPKEAAQTADENAAAVRAFFGESSNSSAKI